MAAVSFENIVKRYDDVTVIDGLELSIADEEFMVFVGPSGCGKSTALRMIAGLESISAGNLRIGDRVVNDIAPKDRDTAMVFQSYALYPHMSVGENIGFGLKIRKVPKPEIERRVKDVARILELDTLLDRKPKALSGGQRQRVALGRAIVRDPSVFLFDEPLSNLDAELRVAMRAEISKLQTELKTTMVYVTHDQVEAMTMGHRIAVLAPLSRGYKTNLMQVGTPMELYDEPQNAFVAKFIGTPHMTVFEVTLDEAGKFTLGGAAISPPERYDLGPLSQPGSKLLVGGRPEHARPGGRAHWTHTAEITTQVRAVEQLGHEIILHVDAQEQRMLGKMVGRVNPPRAGDDLTLTVNLDRLHLFDPETEARVPYKQ